MFQSNERKHFNTCSWKYFYILSHNYNCMLMLTIWGKKSSLGGNKKRAFHHFLSSLTFISLKRSTFLQFLSLPVLYQKFQLSMDLILCAATSSLIKWFQPARKELFITKVNSLSNALQYIFLQMRLATSEISTWSWIPLLVKNAHGLISLPKPVPLYPSRKII